MLFHDVTYFSKDLNYLIKISFVFVSFFYFKDLVIRRENFALSSFESFFKYSFIILSVNLILGIFGIGFGQYGSIGSVGFFYAGNEVSGLMLIIFSVTAYKVFMKRPKYYLVLCAFLLFLSVLKATKVAIAGTFFIVLIVPLLSERKKIIHLTSLKIKYMILSVSLLPFCKLFYLLRCDADWIT